MPEDIQPSDAPTGTPSGGVGQWVKTHKGAAIGGGAVLLVAAYVFLRHRRGASSSSSSGAVPGTTTGGQIYEIAPGSLGSDYGYGSSIGYTSGVQSSSGQPLSQPQNVTGVTSTSGSGAAGSVNTNASGIYAVNGPDVGQPLNPITGTAALADISTGTPVYQLGQTAINFDEAYGTPVGQNIGSINPTGGYVLSPSAVSSSGSYYAV